MLVLKNITIQTLKGRTLLLDCSFSLTKMTALPSLARKAMAKALFVKSLQVLKTFEEILLYQEM